MVYHLNIVEGGVTLPDSINKEYEEQDEAYDALFEFVHSFDGKKFVDGRVVDIYDIDVESISSEM